MKKIIFKNIHFTVHFFLILLFIAAHILAISTLKLCAGDLQKTSEYATSPYALWKNGPLTNPTYFPIGVWLQDPILAEKYKAAGINFYIGLWRGPTDEQLSQLKTAGMRVICYQNEVSLKYKDDPIIIGWMHGDEPDNAQPVRGKPRTWGPAIPPQTIIDDYKKIAANDPTRPVILNLGQGVANEEFRGRAAKYEDYPEYCKGADIVSYDVYPVTNIGKPDGEKYLWYVAKGIDRLHTWTSNKKPVWNVIECTHINNPDKKPTPHQVKAEVWISLIHGSQGLIYFVHEFRPQENDAALLDDPVMLKAVSEINIQIQQLASVLNSPAIENSAKVTSSNPEIPIDIMVKRFQGSLYVFAVPMRLGPVNGTFEISGLTGKGKAEVIGENRNIEVVNGHFEDAFEPYAVHPYKIE